MGILSIRTINRIWWITYIFDSMGGELKMVYNLTAERKSLEEL